MRDEAEPTLIEIIDSDPSAFGSGDGVAPASRGGAPLPRWVIITALGSVLGLAAAALLVWQPWRHEAEATWSNRVLVDRPISSVTDVAIDAPWFGGSAGEVGYVFAEPGAVLPYLHGGEGRSAIWQSSAADSMNAAYWSMRGYTPTPGLQVQGVPARVDGFDGSAVQVSFGPLNGRIYEVNTHAMTKEEAVRLAGAIAVERGRPVLRDDSVLLGMDSVGTFDEFNAALMLLDIGLGGPTTATYTSVEMVRPEGGFVTITSLPDPGDGTLLAMAQLMLGGDATAIVHERPAVAQEVRVLINDDEQARSLVAWHERGRFVVVSGSGGLDETLALAATAHEVDEAAWAPIAEQAYSVDSRFPAYIGFHTADDGSTLLVSATTDERGGLSVCLENLDVIGPATSCAVETDAASPMLQQMELDDLTFIVAMVSPDDLVAELLVTRADGSVGVHTLFRPGGSIPGPAVAVLLPDDFQEAALVVDGKTVATL